MTVVHMDIAQAAAKLRAREVSAVELAQQALRAIRTHQPRLNAFITITEDLALAQAHQADEELARGIDRGPLHGIPYALKDVFSTKGIRTTCGSKIFADHIPDRDAAVYEQLTQAGAGLMVRDGLVSTVRELANRYGSVESVERELKRYERRGSTARNRFERQVRRTQTKFERDVRHRRTRLERTVGRNRARVEKLVADAQDRIGIAS